MKLAAYEQFRRLNIFVKSFFADNSWSADTTWDQLAPVFFSMAGNDSTAFNCSAEASLR